MAFDDSSNGRPTRPTPKTPAGLASDLRRRLRTDLADARAAADGELPDQALADVIAQAISAAFEWHLGAPEHARGIDRVGARDWRPAGGPRGRQQPAREWEDEERGGRGEGDFGGPPRGRGRPEWRPGPGGPGGRGGPAGGGGPRGREWEDRGGGGGFGRGREGPPPRGGFGPRGGGRGGPGGSRGGGFGGRRPRD